MRKSASLRPTIKTNTKPDRRGPVTIQDVADELGMHKSSVSLALSGKGNLAAATRDRVASVARAMGYEPNPLAQRLSYGVNNSVVYIFSGVLDVGLATEKILLIQRHLNRLNLEVPIYTCGEVLATDGNTQATQLRQLCLQRPRAVICAAQMVDNAVITELDNYQSHGGIVVTYDIPLPLPCDQVVFDREDNAYQAARHLIERGHTKLGLSISHPNSWTSTMHSVPQNLRVQGFKRALDEDGLPFHPEWLFENSTYEQGGAELAKNFLSLKERPTGLCIVNDYVALAFMAQIIRAGLRVPDDVSVIGHDNQAVAEYCPVPLTSISHPTEQIAHAVVELLSARLDGSDAPPRTITIHGKLESRQSVSAPINPKTDKIKKRS